jgi:hypothetical protein
VENKDRLQKTVGKTEERKKESIWPKVSLKSSAKQ